CLFFFSSRRRHTRSTRDWSSDVCSSDLVTVYTEGTGVISDDKLSALVQEHFDLRPKGIIQMLDLLRPIYQKTAAYGHFGREEPEFSWEQTNKAKLLRAAAGL